MLFPYLQNASICLHKYSLWKWKIPRIIVQFQMRFFSDWYVIKLYSYKANDYLNNQKK